MAELVSRGSWLATRRFLQPISTTRRTAAVRRGAQQGVGQAWVRRRGWSAVWIVQPLGWWCRTVPGGAVLVVVDGSVRVMRYVVPSSSSWAVGAVTLRAA